MAAPWLRAARTVLPVWGGPSQLRPAPLRAGLVTLLVIAAAMTGIPPAFADPAARGQGPDGSYSVAITGAADGRYEVNIAAVNSHQDVTSSVVRMEIVDDQGTRAFRNPYPGGQIRDTLAFDNRGPCTVRITFEFTSTDGRTQTSAGRPVTIGSASGPSTSGSVSAPDQAGTSGSAGTPGTAGTPGGTEARSAAGCVTPAGMNALIDQDTSDSQRPWKRPPGARVQVNFVVDQTITPEWRADLEHGAEDWNRSPCLDLHIVDSCPTGGNCVTVSALDRMADAGDDGNFDAVEKDGYTTGGRITLSNKLGKNQRRNVAVHEMGHAVGLVHRKGNHVMMNADTFDDIFDPDPTDYENLLFSYDRMQRDASGGARAGNRG